MKPHTRGRRRHELVHSTKIDHKAATESGAFSPPFSVMGGGRLCLCLVLQVLCNVMLESRLKRLPKCGLTASSVDPSPVSLASSCGYMRLYAVHHSHAVIYEIAASEVYGLSMAGGHRQRGTHKQAVWAAINLHFLYFPDVYIG